jgi:hypothetical protein
MARRLLLIPVLAALLLPASALASYRYRGVTSQQESLSFLVSKHVTTVSKFQIDWDATCTSGATLADGSMFRRVRFGLGFRFLDAGTYSYKMVNQGYSAASGRDLLYQAKVSLSGRLHRSSAITGSWTASVAVIDPSTSQQIDSCRSGRVAWRALLH